MPETGEEESHILILRSAFKPVVINGMSSTSERRHRVDKNVDLVQLTENNFTREAFRNGTCFSCGRVFNALEQYEIKRGWKAGNV